MQMAGEDLERIVPLLSVFCSLFSHSLMSLHDADFFRDDDANKIGKFCILKRMNLNKYVLHSIVYMNSQ